MVTDRANSIANLVDVYIQTGKSIMHYFASTEKEKEKYRNDIKPVAKKYREFLHFAITDLNEYPEILQTVGLKPGSKQGLALENPNNGDVFPYKGSKKITADLVDKFLNDVIDGKIDPLPKPGGQGGGDHDEL